MGTFARRLKKVSGMSPIQFMQRIRLDEAKARLANGCSFEEAPAEVGHSDAFALGRVFRG